MGSTRPTDRSIGEATFLPQWMKGKSETRFDYSDSAFSPPADDTFFLIRYPKPTASSSNTTDVNNEGFRSISDFLAGKRDPAPVTDTQATATAASAELSKQSSFQQYASFGADKASEPKLIVANKPKIIKTASDEFNNDKAETGRSIVTVASQIMFGKSSTSATLTTFSSPSEVKEQNSTELSNQQKEPMKKVSKSLPATPIASPNGTPDSSPKSRRRAYGNRFFTGAFVPDGEKKNGWLLGSILGQSRELPAPKIPEEEDEPAPETIPVRALSRKKSISSQNLTYFGKDDKSSSSSTTSHILKAQPSELREMNFWSPTSM